ncbi:MAG TPA: hypothetical protein VLA49_19705 [Anaerolineales bacterium]|nr:hypothetical protein [Anaerolineales bacterium]
MNGPRRSSVIIKLLFLAVFVAGCTTPAATAVVTDTSTKPLQVTPTLFAAVESQRSVLPYADLMQGANLFAPVDNAALTIPLEATQPNSIFEGRLELKGEEGSGELEVLRGDPDLAPEVAHLPEFDFEFVQLESYLIPVKRGLIITEHPYWNYMLEPGRVWQEDGDQGYTRASFPFALIWKGSNATFNGVMTFLFNEQSISKVWYQVTQETAISLSLNLWGFLEASYHPGPVAEADKIRQNYREELMERFPHKSIEQLPEDYKGVDTSSFGGGLTPQHLTWYGVVVGGVNYVGGCQTRFGVYPYCETMRAPSYSTAKSAFVSIALMRLAQKYDASVPELLIKDYVPEAAASPGDWDKVTFNNTLDMATGNYRSAGFMVDEESWDSDPFWTEEYYEKLISAAFNWPNSAAPGTRWVYRTSDTFILTRAMQNYLQTMEGLGADIFQFVVDEVYKPLKVNPGTYTVLRTRDNDWQGQPYGGLGQWWIPDDLAKITELLNVDVGVIAGDQILHPGLLKAALQGDPEDRGVDIDFNRKYNNAFWANRYSEANGFACEFWVPQMLGYSGIVVALFPNGITYYYASDNREFTWEAALREADKIAPLCP